MKDFLNSEIIKVIFAQIPNKFKHCLASQRLLTSPRPWTSNGALSVL